MSLLNGLYIFSRKSILFLGPDMVYLCRARQALALATGVWAVAAQIVLSALGPGPLSTEANASLPDNVSLAHAFEINQRATGQDADDPFHTVPPDSQDLPPGTLLKLEPDTDPNLYTIPPGCALSRFTYQSQTPSGTRVPVSAYILWPYATS